MILLIILLVNLILKNFSIMHRRFINPILLFPLCLFVNPPEELLSQTSNNIEEVIQEKPIFYLDIGPHS